MARSNAVAPTNESNVEGVAESAQAQDGDAIKTKKKDGADNAVVRSHRLTFVDRVDKLVDEQRDDACGDAYAFQRAAEQLMVSPSFHQTNNHIFFLFCEQFKR